MVKFDPYDYIGVIVPGTTIVLTVALLYPDLAPALQASISLGDLGLVLILAFLSGHLLQAIGNLWEWIIWRLAGGMPSTWAAKAKTSLLTEAQLKRLADRLAEDFATDRSALADGRGLMREIVVVIRRSGKLERVEKFNRNYGLMRGVAAGFIVAALLVLITEPTFWRAAGLLLGGAGLATYRMVRFGVHYARETYAEYLNLPIADQENAPSAGISQGSAT